MMISRCLSVILLLSAVSARAAPPLDLKSAAPALGRDWMDPVDTVDIANDPNPWPLGDAASAGLDDMIHDERKIIGGAASPRAVPDHLDQRVFRTLRKVGGDYIVVPLFTFHLDRTQDSEVARTEP